MKHLSSPARARRLLRAAVSLVFAIAVVLAGLAPRGSETEAKSRPKASRRARVAASKSKARAAKRQGARAGREESEPVAEPTDGETGEGDISQREEWFRFQRAYPFADVPEEARRAAWESRPKGHLKPSQLRGALSASAVQWTPIGPAPTSSAFSSRWGLTSGHVRAIAVKPDDPNVVLIGGASGGIWRSTNAANPDPTKVTFTPVSDSQVDLAVGSLAFAPSNPNVVYAGMGAQSGFGSYLGTGVLKSTDGGATWSRVDTFGLTKRGRSVSIAVDPSDPNRVYLCHFIQQPDDTSPTTASTAFSDGFYVSTDGGSTWTRTLRGLPESVVVSPADPNVIFLSMARIDPAGTNSAGVYKSVDRGQTWSLSYSLNVLTSAGKDCYVAVTPADPHRVYAVSRGATSTTVSLAYSINDGANWTALADSTGVDMGQWGYNSYIYASPTNADTVYVGTRDVWRATNVTSGATWTNLTNNFSATGSYHPGSSFAHPDQHSFAFAPGDGSTFYIGSDGGIWRTTTAGVGAAPFASLNSSLTLQQFVGIATHLSTPGITYGGTQDNGTQVRGQDAVGWQEFATGDGGRVNVVPSDPTIVFPSYVGGTIWRYGNNGATFQKTVGNGTSTFKDSTTGTADRIPFYPPIVTNGADSTLYVGTHRLWVSTDLGDTWNAPGGTTDLTNGGSDVLSAIGASRSNPQVIYTGSSFGHLMVSQNGGASWGDISSGFPTPAGTATRFVSSIVVDPSNPSVAYVTVSGFGTGHVWKTVNMGASWSDLSGTNAATKLPNIPTSALLIEPGTGLIYAGTDVGVFRSSGDGNWEALTNGLPPVPVSSFAVNAAGKIQIGTFGRGAYELSPADTATVQFASAAQTVSEAAGSAQITVTRSGNLGATVSVNVRTVDDQTPVPCNDTTTKPGVAFARCDYATTIETVTFAPNETQKAVAVPLVNDSYVEPDETVQLALSSPVNAALGGQSTTTLVITSDDAAGAVNPYFDTNFFVRQQYLDFLSREPDAAGFSDWVNLLNGCPNPFNTNVAPYDSVTNPSARCDRIAVSASFFLSTEFQLKGGYVFRFYRASLGRLPTYVEMTSDMRGVTGTTPAEVYAKKAAFTNAWVQRPDFKAIYDAMSNAQFVNAMMDRYGLQQITTPQPSDPDGATKVPMTRASMTASLDTNTLTRAQVVRAIADSDEVTAAEFNSAFVTMQYVGYLRRDPDPSGYNDWLTYLNSHPGAFRVMVFGFIGAPEYKSRFGNP